MCGWEGDANDSDAGRDTRSECRWREEGSEHRRTGLKSRLNLHVHRTS